MSECLGSTPGTTGSVPQLPANMHTGRAQVTRFQWPPWETPGWMLGIWGKKEASGELSQINILKIHKKVKSIWINALKYIYHTKSCVFKNTFATSKALLFQDVIHINYWKLTVGFFFFHLALQNRRVYFTVNSTYPSDSYVVTESHLWMNRWTRSARRLQREQKVLENRTESRVFIWNYHETRLDTRFPRAPVTLGQQLMQWQRCRMLW